MRRSFPMGLAVLVAGPLFAQAAAQPLRHAVRGAVFDSVARAPLAGAVVQVTSRDSLGALYSSTTDSAGHFRIDDLPSGRFLIGFYHDALSALGLDAPLRSFELAADTLATIDIGVPAGPVVRALRCGGDSADRRNGMLAGFIRATGASVVPVGATVAVEWRAIALDPGNFRTVPQRESASVAGDGTYSLCALPIDAPVTLRVTAPGYHAVVGRIVVPPTGVARQDVRLADASVLRGAASLHGRVLHESGKPVTSARAVIAALALDTPVRDGAFVMTGVPTGTWVVEVRIVGLEPESVLFDARDGGTASITIMVSDRTQQLDAVTVVGEPGRNTKVLQEVLRRQRSSFGTTFLPGNAWLQNANQIADVLRAAKGFAYRSPTDVRGRPLPGRLLAAETRCTNIAVYLNGERVLGGLADINNFVLVRDVLAIEAYADLTAVPVQWRTHDGACAVVAVWTSRRG